MIRQVSSEEALRLVKQSKALVLDVRTVPENIQSRIKGAVNIPLDQLSSRAHEIPRDRPLLVYCRSGSRSLMASRILLSHGFRQVLNLESGIIDCPFECLEQ